MPVRLALYTFGIFIAPADSAANAGFHRRNDPILALVGQAPGFIARSGYPDDPGPPSWGPQVYPRFYEERGDGWSPATLSLWVDMESAMAFSYAGLHAEALRHGREWFRKPQWPPYACWWAADGRSPTWAEAVERHEHLHDNGPTPFAFSFSQAFDAQGNPTELDRDRLKAFSG